MSEQQPPEPGPPAPPPEAAPAPYAPLPPPVSSPPPAAPPGTPPPRSEEHTSELQSHLNLVCRLLLEKKKNASRTSRLTTLRHWVNSKASTIHQRGAERDYHRPGS